MPLGKKGFQRGIILFKDKNHPCWKGGKPHCIECNKILASYKSKRCQKCSLKYNKLPKLIKGIQNNTGRTHFKKGMIPWNKDKKMSLRVRLKISRKRKGIPMPKPKYFSQKMRLVNPPKGKKIKFDSRDKLKKNRIWRKGYIYIYKPDHPSSRKFPPDYGYITEHRMIMEEYTSRQLVKGEVIHHIDGDKSNNELKNLILCKNTQEHLEIHNQMEVFVEKLIREDKVYYDQEKKEFRIR